MGPGLVRSFQSLGLRQAGEAGAAVEVEGGERVPLDSIKHYRLYQEAVECMTTLIGQYGRFKRSELRSRLSAELVFL